MLYIRIRLWCLSRHRRQTMNGLLMMNRLLLVVCLLVTAASYAQVTNTATMDTTDISRKGKVTVDGYIDAYYLYSFNKPGNHTLPYLVSMNKHNEMTVNLAFIDLKYSSSRMRARFVPAYGTFMNANYSSEEGSLKNILEASIGVRVSEKHNIWIDAGVFGSPYTNESAISKDHLTYTRSLAPEFVPYYLSGVKMNVPLSSRVNAFFYLLNGWQQIGDQNNNKAIGTQLEYRPTDHLLLNWNTFAGKEHSAQDTTLGVRVFSDFYFIYARSRFTATGCVYGGIQRQATRDAGWWQANLIGRYAFTPVFSLSARVEYFHDPYRVQVAPVTPASHFSCTGASLGGNFKIAENMLVRSEVRYLRGDAAVFKRDGRDLNEQVTATMSMTIWF